jgi:DNA-binding response OmpR family regulator
MAHVLLIDDEPNILVVMRALFRAAGHEVTTVPGGHEAVRLIREGHFDLMVSDVRMNPINGIEFLKLARAEKPALPVIMVTAYGSDATRDQILEMGASAYLKKPFENQELMRVVNQALQRISKVDL